MAFELDTFEELVAQANAETRRKKPDLDPTIFGSFTLPYNTSAAALAFSIEQTVGDLKLQLFPQTAEGEFLDDWAGYELLERKGASSAFGFMSIEGVLSTAIPLASEFTSAEGFVYQSQIATTVENVNQDIVSITRSGTTARATTDGDHSLASGINVTVSGADQAEYNGTFAAVVTARDKFTYEIVGAPVTPATGTIEYDAVFAIVDLIAQDVGQQTNLASGAVLTATPAITDINSTGTAQFDGLSGGADIETDAELFARVLLSRSIIEGVFTPDQIRLAGLSVAGNTRIFVVRPELSVSQTSIAAIQSVSTITRSGSTATVTTAGNHQLVTDQPATIIGADQAEYNGSFFITVTGDTTFTYEVTGTPATPATGTINALSCVFTEAESGFVPAPGQVAAYVLRDNDIDIIPTQTVLDLTKDAIIADGALPAHSSENDVFVLAPTLAPADFVFSSISPDTTTMRNAIQLQLEAFFEDTVDFEATITEATYLGTIQNTQDLQTGEFLKTFSLSSPSGDLVPDRGEIITLGSVSFP